MGSGLEAEAPHEQPAELLEGAQMPSPDVSGEKMPRKPKKSKARHADPDLEQTHALELPAPPGVNAADGSGEKLPRKTKKSQAHALDDLASLEVLADNCIDNGELA